MALLHRATLSPTKLELLATWLPGRAWYQGSPGGALERVAACRFDDPAGEVGIETILVRADDGPIYHVPLTYRGTPLAGADGSLVGTCEHSVLGRRWVYDACGDPIYATALADVIAGRVGQADEFMDTESGPERRQPAMTVAGSGHRDVAAVKAIRRVTDGDPTIVETDSGRLAVFRVVDVSRQVEGAALTGFWPDGPSAVLASSDG